VCKTVPITDLALLQAKLRASTRHAVRVLSSRETASTRHMRLSLTHDSGDAVIVRLKDKYTLMSANKASIRLEVVTRVRR
jgi:hypothetical protein